MTYECYNEDCFTTLARIPDKSVRLLLQDPPFGVTRNEWDIAPDLAKMWPEWERVAMGNAAFVFFATQPFATDLIMSNRKMFRYDLIWQKSQATGFLNASKMPLREHELILVFYKSLPVFNPQIFDKPKKNIRPKNIKPRLSDNYGQFAAGDTRKIPVDKSFPGSLLFYENEQPKIHVTQKPIDLIRYLILTYSNPGDLVFDGYMGSGTTLVAAHQEGRQCIGSETDKGYYDQLQKRFKEHSSKLTLL